MLYQGRIRTLSQQDKAKDRWSRREIIVQRDPCTGSPNVGDDWTLIDEDGDTYRVRFVRGANVIGYTCLGQPGRLKSWFRKYYPCNQVVKNSVFFRSTGNPDVYEILTEKQWGSRNSSLGT